MLAAIKRLGPLSAKQLAAEIGVNHSSARTTIRRARAYGTLHLRIAAWVGDVALYGLGPGADAEGGPTGMRVLHDLEFRGEATVATLAARLGLDVSAVDSAVRRLRAKPGTLHVAKWQRQVGTGGRESAVYAIGMGKDAPRPDLSSAAAEYESRRVAKRRVTRVLSGLPVRGPRRVRHAVVAGPFDGLLR